jgi:predicted transposase/invertase (TIGR01784 family)
MKILSEEEEDKLTYKQHERYLRNLAEFDELEHAIETAIKDAVKSNRERIAKNCLRQGIEIDIIATATNLTVEQVNQLKEEVQ